MDGRERGGVGGRWGVHPRPVSTFNDIIGGCHLPSTTSGQTDSHTSIDTVMISLYQTLLHFYTR